jgi:hypothetical protein
MSKADKMRKASMEKNKYKKKPYSDRNHPMNRERTGASVLKEDPLYKSSGGTVLNNR